MLDLRKDTKILKDKYDSLRNSAELGKISKDEYYNEIRKLVKDNKELINGSILEFFDNDLFIPCNANKDFSDQDMAVIIIHSENTTLERKFEALKEVKENTKDSILRQEIEEWISAKDYYLSYIKSVNRGDMCFMKCFDILVTNPKIYSTFEKATCDVYYNDIMLESIDSNIGSLMKIKYPIGYNGIRTVENKVSNIFLMSNRISEIDKEFKKYDSKLYKRSVELEHPFFPFDFLEMRGYPEFIKYVIIADNSDEYVKKCKVDPNRNSPKSWAKLNIANYYLETTPYKDYGKIKESFFFEYVRCSLNGIKLINKYGMTGYQTEYMNEVKAQLKERK